TPESLFDGKLTAYSRLASSISLGRDLEAGGSVARREDIRHEAEGLMKKRQPMLNDPLSPLSQSTLHAVQRHRDALQDYTRDFHRAKTNIQAALDKTNLLSNVRNDIDAYRTARSSDADSLRA
ncbi:hypothetical protein BS47DRAFT_1418324, partial [Hydnum rufescens UP504]